MRCFLDAIWSDEVFGQVVLSIGLVVFFRQGSRPVHIEQNVFGTRQT